MPSLVPHVRRNTVCSTRNALPQPPAHVYITSVDGNDSLDLSDRRMLFEMSALKSRASMSAKSESGAPTAACPHCDDQPLDHPSPHKYPPASFVAAAACAASPSNTLEDDDDDKEEEGVSLKGTFKVLVGGDTSALDDLSYSSAEDDEDYDDNLR